MAVLEGLLQAHQEGPVKPGQFYSDDSVKNEAVFGEYTVRHKKESVVQIMFH